MQRTALLPLGWKPMPWLAFMIVASVALTLGFACATPLAAFGALSALSLGRKSAVLFTGAIWAANQAVGYAILDYPLTANSLAWGLVIGMAAVLGVLAARWIAVRFAELSRVGAMVAAFVAAFAVYELTLFAAAFAILGGTASFTLSIIGRIFEINAIAMTGLVLVSCAGTLANRPERTASPLPAG